MNKNHLLFIVGMPRSGTKLFRDLLNQHPQISIPEVETHFLPKFIKKYGIVFPNVASVKDEILKDFMKTTFYWNVKKDGYSIDDDFIMEYINVESWADFNVLMF